MRNENGKLIFRWVPFALAGFNQQHTPNQNATASISVPINPRWMKVNKKMLAEKTEN